MEGRRLYEKTPSSLIWIWIGNRFSRCERVRRCQGCEGCGQAENLGNEGRKSRQCFCPVSRRGSGLKYLLKYFGLHVDAVKAPAVGGVGEADGQFGGVVFCCFWDLMDLKDPAVVLQSHKVTSGGCLCTPGKRCSPRTPLWRSGGRAWVFRTSGRRARPRPAAPPAPRGGGSSCAR